LKTIPEQELRWHVLYTKSRAEKKVFEQLCQSGLEAYLPLIKVERQWSDRKKLVEVPLFNSYLFVKPLHKESYYSILQMPHVVRFVTFGGKPAIIPDKQVEAIQLMLNDYQNLQLEICNEVLEPGQKVEICAGPLKGLTGMLVDCKGAHKFSMRIDALDQSLMVVIPDNILKVIV
jgi:transcription antitermination factor NusG